MFLQIDTSLIRHATNAVTSGDSAAIVLAAKSLAGSIAGQVANKELPGLDPRVSLAVANGVSVVVGLAAAFGVGRFAAMMHSKAGTSTQAAIQVFWAAHRRWINALVASGVAYLGSHSITAFLPVLIAIPSEFGDGFLRSVTTTTKAGLSTTAAVLLLGCALWAGPARADALKGVPWGARERFQAQFRAGVRGPTPIGGAAGTYGGARLHYGITDRLNGQLDVVKPLKSLPRFRFNQDTEFDLSVGLRVF